MSEKYVYSFDEGKKEMKELLGGKGANLSEMTSIGIPVPFGFTITTEVCDYYNRNNRTYPANMQEQIDEKLALVEEKMGMKFGDSENPLLLSVRSGAAVSMPGMMDTVLNLGMNDTTVMALAKKSGNERFAYDAYRRFIQMFGNVVLEIEHNKFEHALDKMKETKGVKFDTDLTADDLKNLVLDFKKIVKETTGKDMPEDPKEQLALSIEAVFKSWSNPRALAYRRMNDIVGLLGTAVNVQAMVFGNMGETSGTGVCFTRDPSTGENKFYGEFLMNAQGEDVVAGIKTPEPIDKLKEVMPEAYSELVGLYQKLENHYKDMQDIEFTIQDKKLYLLQTRNGKRTAAAAVRIAVEMVGEGLIEEKEAVLRVDPNSLNQLLHKQLDKVAQEKAEKLAKGLPASPGAAVGKAVFSADKAKVLASTGETVILVRQETSPEDIEGMAAAQGILTSRGGMTSHAAVVARGMGTACVAGCADIVVNEDEKFFKTPDGVVIKEGDYISLDGGLGEIYKGQVPTTDPELSGNFGTLMEWADKYRTMGVRTNADTPNDSLKAREFGAEGIGLCRTEHMFFEGERIKAVREMILANSKEGREKALDKLLPMQRGDFAGLFEAMKDLPVTIRLLDPPLHEFLPQKEGEIAELAKEMEVEVGLLKEKISQLHELNPMLGHRGCRLAITYPEIARMQTRAIIEAALEVKAKGIITVPEIMIPLIGHVNELKILKEVVDDTVQQVFTEKGDKVDYLVGTMIEIPRAALTADEVAEYAEFFSFGTNDLTQMTFGYSRDDVGSFVQHYVENSVLEKDPFQAIDQTGVGALMKIGVEKGRSKKSKLKIGICGEHGGEPSSVEFCHRIGFDYVSCSPFRVPIARLAAAQAALKNPK